LRVASSLAVVRHEVRSLLTVGRTAAVQEDIMALSIASRAFDSGGPIPAKYTCDGEDISPELQWSSVPSSAKSLALIVEDPDAPDPAKPKMVYVHWVLYNLPANVSGLAEAVAKLPAGAMNGTNDWNRTGYGGPCPPVGRHRYFFKLYALDCVLPDIGHATKKELLQAMDGHIVEQAEYMGTYQKAR
jgi:Raf kinase inhibitor-like YbhB/YbcL family protein